MLTQGRRCLRFAFHFYEYRESLRENCDVFFKKKTNSLFTCRLTCDATVFKLELQLPHLPKNDPTVRVQEAAILADSSDVCGGSSFTSETRDMNLKILVTYIHLKTPDNNCSK